jgi:uncharacterized Rossmann fold enzyme
LAVQDEVRAAFGWSLSDDQRSARALSDRMLSPEPFGVPHWSSAAREAHLERLASMCRAASRVVVVGAAATVEEVTAAAGPGTVFVAADGAAGAVPAHLPLIAVVSDLDGGVHLHSAVERGPVVVLHAHGDNRSAWEQHLATWADLDTPPPLVLTHQGPDLVAGMHNPGGFTDGDRAVCLLRWMDVPKHALAFVGFALDKVGPWSGVTDPNRKLQKLTWMAEVLHRLGMMHEALPQDEHS